LKETWKFFIAIGSPIMMLSSYTSCMTPRANKVTNKTGWQRYEDSFMAEFGIYS
jgi:hypothetical protein